MTSVTLTIITYWF